MAKSKTFKSLGIIIKADDDKCYQAILNDEQIHVITHFLSAKGTLKVLETPLEGIVLEKPSK